MAPVPQRHCPAANALARSTSSEMSTVSSNAELNRLTEGASPHDLSQSRYSSGVIPSGMSALTAVKPIAAKSARLGEDLLRLSGAVPAPAGR